MVVRVATVKVHTMQVNMTVARMVKVDTMQCIDDGSKDGEGTHHAMC